METPVSLDAEDIRNEKVCTFMPQIILVNPAFRKSSK